MKTDSFVILNINVPKRRCLSNISSREYNKVTQYKEMFFTYMAWYSVKYFLVVFLVILIIYNYNYEIKSVMEGGLRVEYR